MRRASLALALALAACATGRPPPRALTELEQGKVAQALASAWEGEADAVTRDAVARVALLRARPRLVLEQVKGEDLAAAAGLHTARQVLGACVVVRATLESEAYDLPADEVDLVFEAADGKLPVLGHSPESLAVITGEHYPSGREWSEWKFARSPFDPLGAKDPVGMVAGLVGAIIFAPIQLLTLHSESHYQPPTDEEIAAAVPRASRAAKAFADRPGVRYFLVRRPAQQTPITVLISATVGTHGLAGMRTKASWSLSEPRSSIALAPLMEEVFLGRGKPVHESCESAPYERRFDEKSGSCKLAALAPEHAIAPIGLTPPPRPSSLGSSAASASKRPWWTDSSRYAPNAMLAKAEPRPLAEGEEMVLVVCDEHQLDREIFPVVHLGKDDWHPAAGSRFTIPLAHLGAAGTFTVELLSTSSVLLIFNTTHHHGTLVFARKGGELVVRSASSPEIKDKVSCFGLGREAVEALVEDRWLQAVDELDAVDETHFRYDVRKGDFGHELSGLRQARSAIEGVAALAGWGDARVQALLAREASLDARFGAGVKQAITAWEAALAQRDKEQTAQASPDAGVAPQRTDFELTLTALRCDNQVAAALKDSEKTAGGRCVVDAELTNRDSSPRYPSMMVRDLYVVLEDGRVGEVGLLGKDDGPIAPGASRKLSLAAVDLPAPSRSQKPFRIIVGQIGQERRPLALPPSP